MEKFDVNKINLKIDSVDFWSPHSSNKGGMRIYWSADIGVGEMTIYKDKGTEGDEYMCEWIKTVLCADTEHMDIQSNKSFTNKLLEILAEELIITE